MNVQQAHAFSADAVDRRLDGQGLDLSSPAKQRETAQYVSDMILELRNMAKAAKLNKVLVPLEYAYYEAFSAANRVNPPVEDIEKIRQLSKAGEALSEEKQD